MYMDKMTKLSEQISLFCIQKIEELLTSKPFFYSLKEAQTGFEPVNQGVADPCLTTWLLRLITCYAQALV